ncbi:hypothetical protein MSAN_02403400 [Mycena sanguinolenta]|uniref:DUF6589 domain-containing protein n=1 Tax=Mycena sanguinolenta TaxID=230812 RepID=A0A8H6X499_9AGAR|nr:hypothetical protein MSAN_02403400 [Mycena sanguinolenta]
MSSRRYHYHPYRRSERLPSLPSPPATSPSTKQLHQEAVTQLDFYNSAGVMVSWDHSMAAAPPPHGPVPPLETVLDWNYTPATIPDNIKLRCVIRILKTMKMAPMDLVTTILDQTDTFRPNIDGFYRGTTLEQFLNLVKRDKRGRSRLSSWFEQQSKDALIQDIHHEMDNLSALFRCYTQDVTPESILEFDFEQDVTEVCRETAPKLRSILMAAAQTVRAARENTFKDVEPDLHSKLAVGQIRRAQTAARMGHSVSWDNTNISLSVHVEQRTFAPPKVQTRTTQLIYDLRGLSDPTALELKPILDRRAGADLISFADIRPSYSQCTALRNHLIISIVQLMTNNSGFDYVRNHPLLQHASYRPPLTNHKTNEYVNENVYLDQLQFGIHDLDNIAVPSYNDQKTNALIRSAQLQRKGDVSAILRLEHLQLAPGAFHMELNLSWMILKIHRGDGADLGSLQYFIGLLSKVRLGSDQPDFETLVSLLMQVLTSAILHYWEVETGKTITQLAQSRPSASRLQKYASGIDDPLSDSSPEDYTTRNLSLLIRDTLIFHFLQTSISSGDFGRGLHELPDRAPPFSAEPPEKSGPNLSRETIIVLNVVRDNPLISTSGRSYVDVDKNAEFNINFQKHYFAAKGVHASWDLLSDLAPNVPILRRLKTQFGEFLGAPWQGTRHSNVDCSEQIDKVKAKMREYQLHLPFISCRKATETEAIDVVETGASILRKQGIKKWAKAYTSWLNAE